jgi:hypothetical protein
MTTVKSYSTTNIQMLYNDESSYSYSYSFQHVTPDIVGIRIDNIKFNNIDTKIMDLYDDTFLAFSIKGEIENSRNLSDIYFLAEEKDYFFNITLKSDVDISKIEFVTQLCYKPSSKKPGCDYCSFIKDSKNTVYALYRQPLELSLESPSDNLTVLKNNSNIPTMQINKDDKDDNLTADKDDNLAADKDDNLAANTEASPGEKGVV